MRRLILLISVIFIYTISLLLANYTKDYYFVFNLCIIPIVISGYFFSGFATLLLVSLCCILGFSLIYANATHLEIFQGILLFLICASLSTIINKGFNKLKGNSENNLKLLKEKITELNLEASRLKDNRIYLEHRASEISKLYYSVKKMASSPTLDELLTVLRDIMIDSFKFKRCEFITLYHMQEGIKIDKIYQITKDKINQIGSVGYEEGLLKVMLRKKQELVVDSKKGKIDAEEFIFPEYLNTFIAFPIISGEKTNAILIAEDIDIEQKDQFAVLANQFSMTLERVKLYELVQELAITDGLTGVFVRRHMLERLNEELARAAHFNTRVSLLMIDIDDFKKYNDNYGHLKGDILLKKVASVLKNEIREIDVIGRYGGEEFCTIFPDTDSKGAEFVANRLREKVKILDTTISIGIATYPEDAKDASHLIERADKMLYKAKQTGKDKVCIYASR